MHRRWTRLGRHGRPCGAAPPIIGLLPRPDNGLQESEPERSVRAGRSGSVEGASLVQKLYLATKSQWTESAGPLLVPTQMVLQELTSTPTRNFEVRS